MRCSLLTGCARGDLELLPVTQQRGCSVVAKLSLDNKLAQAAAVYRAIPVQHPQNAEVLRLLGMIEAQINPLAAIELIDRAIKLWPRDAGFFSNRGIVLQQNRSLRRRAREL